MSGKLLKIFPARFTDLKAATDCVYALPIAFVAIMSNHTTYNRMTHIMRMLDEKEGKG